jgi:hypothetical protein
MSRVIRHRDGSKTVWFDNGNKATFGPPRPSKPARTEKKITGTPYVFAAGPKIELPGGISHGMIFEHRRQYYVALYYKGKDTAGRHAHACYGQPIRLTRPVR